jgi:hypothetical protein
MSKNLLSDLVQIEHAITRAIYTAQSTAEDKTVEELRVLRTNAEALTNSIREHNMHPMTTYMRGRY